MRFSPFALLFICLLGSAAFAAEAPMFTNEEAARRHCPRDIVVWLNLDSGIYHFKSEHAYTRTRRGAFVCLREAEKAGDQAPLGAR